MGTTAEITFVVFIRYRIDDSYDGDNDDDNNNDDSDDNNNDDSDDNNNDTDYDRLVIKRDS